MNKKQSMFNKDIFWLCSLISVVIAFVIPLQPKNTATKVGTILAFIIGPLILTWIINFVYKKIKPGLSSVQFWKFYAYIWMALVIMNIFSKYFFQK